MYYCLLRFGRIIFGPGPGQSTSCLYFIQIFLGQNADNHIFRFVQSKFGFEDQTDFETRLYLCLPIFQPLSWDYYRNFGKTMALPLYSATVLFELFCIVMTVFKRWHSKEKSEDKDHQVSFWTQFFNWLDEKDHWRFVVERRKEPELCYHIGTIFAHFYASY